MPLLVWVTIPSREDDTLLIHVKSRNIDTCTEYGILLLLLVT